MDKTEEHRAANDLEEIGQVSVLVIENEEDIRCLLSDILASDGHKVRSASNGADALEIFNQERFDLVLTYSEMPVMSGWEVANAIKELAPGVIIAIITGWSTQLDHSELKKNGVDIVVNKPFRVSQILKLVQEAREMKDTRRQGTLRTAPP